MWRSGRGSIAVLGLSFAVLSMSGCSWAFTQPLREDRSPSDYPVCSTSPTPPVVDTLFFVANAGSSSYLAVQDNVNRKALLLSVGFTEAAIWLLSATYGFSKINECIDAVGSYKTGYQPPPIGTGGEVFLKPPGTAPRQPAAPPATPPPPPPPPSPPATPPPPSDMLGP